MEIQRWKGQVSCPQEIAGVIRSSCKNMIHQEPRSPGEEANLQVSYVHPLPPQLENWGSGDKWQEKSVWRKEVSARIEWGDWFFGSSWNKKNRRKKAEVKKTLTSSFNIYGPPTMGQAWVKSLAWRVWGGSDISFVQTQKNLTVSGPLILILGSLDLQKSKKGVMMDPWLF